MVRKLLFSGVLVCFGVVSYAQLPERPGAPYQGDKFVLHCAQQHKMVRVSPYTVRRLKQTDNNGIPRKQTLPTRIAVYETANVRESASPQQQYTLSIKDSLNLDITVAMVTPDCSTLYLGGQFGAMVDNTVAVNQVDGFVMAYDLHKGQQRWISPILGKPGSSPTDKVFVTGIRFGLTNKANIIVRVASNAGLKVGSQVVRDTVNVKSFYVLYTPDGRRQNIIRM